MERSPSNNDHPTTDAMSNCAICYEAFDDEAAHLPRMLVCGHSFCTSCLAQLARGNNDNQLPCPKCRRVTQLQRNNGPNGVSVDQLPRNFDLLDLIADTKQHQRQHQSRENNNNSNNKRSCDECSNGAAVEYCVECGSHFCLDCNVKLHLFRALKSHVRMPSAAAPPPRPTCSSHRGKLMEYWCEQDSAAVCTSCVLVGAHQGHKVVALEEAAKRSAQEARQKLARLEDGMHNVEKALADVEATAQAEQQSAAQARAAVAQHFAQVRDAVAQRERALEGELATWEKERGDARKTKREQLLAAKERLQQVGRQVQELMGVASDTQQQHLMAVERHLAAIESGSMGRVEEVVKEVCSAASESELLSFARGTIEFKAEMMLSLLGRLVHHDDACLPPSGTFPPNRLSLFGLPSASFSTSGTFGFGTPTNSGTGGGALGTSLSFGGFALPSTSSPSFSFTSGFSFGGSSATGTPAATTFVTSPATSSAAPSVARSLFSFGSSATPSIAPSLFSFGSSATPSIAPSPCSFGGPTMPSTAPIFSFGPATPFAAPSVAPSTFSFGGPATPSAAPSTFSFGGPATPSAAPSVAPSMFGFGALPHPSQPPP